LVQLRGQFSGIRGESEQMKAELCKVPEGQPPEMACMKASFFLRETSTLVPSSIKA
jgi:hypothetical protein